MTTLNELLDWVNKSDRILFINGMPAELDNKKIKTCLTFWYSYGGEEHDLFLDTIKSIKWMEDEYCFRVRMKNKRVYDFEVYELVRVYPSKRIGVTYGL